MFTCNIYATLVFSYVKNFKELILNEKKRL